MDDPVRLTMHDPDEGLPTCPACGAQATRGPDGSYITTAHAHDCAWALDPDSEPYD